MKPVTLFSCLLFLVVCYAVPISCQDDPATGGTTPDLSPGVQAVINMQKSGVPADMMIRALQSSQTSVVLTANDLIALKAAGVPDDVVRALAGEPLRNNDLALNKNDVATARSAPASKPSAAPNTAMPAPIDLRSVRRIYVEKMPNDLDQYIRAEITKKFKGAVVVVLDPSAADAVMVGTGEKRDGVGSAITGRYLGLHDNSTGAISLVDREGTVVLWSSEAGDRSIWWGALKRGGARKVADRLINNLKKAMGR